MATVTHARPTGLQSIDPMLYEAARADGANRWQILWRVTLPLLRPTLALTTVLSLTGSLLAFDQFFILTGGRHETATVVISVYREAFLSQDLGRAAGGEPGWGVDNYRRLADYGSGLGTYLLNTVVVAVVAVVVTVVTTTLAGTRWRG
ncbi:carbohydrate ABC transporter permease [Saccharothrix sp. ALI-22-I]|uniref:carbohydrate ABC transporter permease n=1 Tax=Saccharothrix sp. ALI-22-I TaxID=1933778 RepID=UPI001179B29E|nr:sugar ABC transporter permease [Saccharothrix sp. ALI-22-I]